MDVKLLILNKLSLPTSHILYKYTKTPKTYNYGIPYVLLYILNLLPLLAFAESAHVQDPHLLHYGRLARLARAEQEQPVRRPVNLFVFAQLPVYLVADTLLGAGVVGCRRRRVPVAEAAHHCQRRPPAAGGALLGGGRRGAALRARRHRGCRRPSLCFSDLRRDENFSKALFK